MYCFPGESFFWTKLNLKKVSKPFISYGMPEIGPLQDPVKWYGINYARTQISKQRKVGLDWYEFLCFESPTALLASQRNLFRTIWPDPAKGLLAIKSRGCLNSNRTLHVNSGKQTVFYKCADRVRSLPVFFCVTWHHTIIPLQLGLEMGRHDEWMPFRFSCQRPTGRRLTDPNISRSEWKKWSTFP